VRRLRLGFVDSTKCLLVEREESRSRCRTGEASFDEIYNGYERRFGVVHVGRFRQAFYREILPWRQNLTGECAMRVLGFWIGANRV